MMMVNRGPVSIIGSGGNINKLYRLVPKKVWLDNRLSLVQLDRL
jgi:exopolyphosphatase/guanosine-5'-triphosphate,3'-diphosphate pyrophosphatase